MNTGHTNARKNGMESSIIAKEWGRRAPVGIGAIEPMV